MDKELKNLERRITNMNKTFLTGNLTKDVETRETASGYLKASFRIAVKRPYSKDETDFFDVIAWRKLAEICQQYLKKGSKVAISGYFTTRTYEDNNGVKRYAVELICEDMEMLSHDKPTNTTEEQPRRKQTLMAMDEDWSDCPF
jgi:single-strand DNA-binding protein